MHFYFRLEAVHLKSIRRELASIEIKTGKLTTLYNKAFIDRDFNQDLIVLVSRLEELLEAFNALDDDNPINVIVTDKSINLGEETFEDSMRPNYVFVVGSAQKEAKDNPKLFYIATNMTNYFQGVDLSCWCI